MARLRPLLYDYYARMSTTFSAGGITLENIASHRISEDILLSHLVFKCLVKIGVWLWSKLGKCTGEELSVNFNWVLPFFSSGFVEFLTFFLLARRTITELIESVKIPGCVTEKHSNCRWPSQWINTSDNNHSYQTPPCVWKILSTSATALGRTICIPSTV